MTKFRMKIVILGAGQVGSTAAYQLSREEANEVTVVDATRKSCAIFRIASTSAPSPAMAAYPSVLEAAGAAEADILIALTNER